MKVRYDPHPNLITYLITLRYIMNPNPNLITYLNPHPNLRYVITHNVPEKINKIASRTDDVIKKRKYHT